MIPKPHFLARAIAFAIVFPAIATPAAAQDVTKLPLTLEEAVRRAVDHNPDLAVIRLGVDSESERLAGTRGAFDPVFQALAARSGQAAAPLSAFQGTEAVTTGEWFSSAGLTQRLRRGGGTWTVSWDAARITTNNQFSAYDPALQSGLHVAFSQPLLKNRTIDVARHQYVIAGRGKERAELRFRESVVQTVATVKLAYWTLKAAVANVSVQQRSLELAEDLVRQNRARVNIGQVPPLDLVQAEAEVAQRRENLIRAETIAKDAEDRLRRLIMDPGDANFWQRAHRSGR